jgi:hypothetical protein
MLRKKHFILRGPEVQGHQTWLPVTQLETIDRYISHKTFVLQDTTQGHYIMNKFSETIKKPQHYYSDGQQSPTHIKKQYEQGYLVLDLDEYRSFRVEVTIKNNILTIISDSEYEKMSAVLWFDYILEQTENNFEALQSSKELKRRLGWILCLLKFYITEEKVDSNNQDSVNLNSAKFLTQKENEGSDQSNFRFERPEPQAFQEQPMDPKPDFEVQGQRG